MTTEQAIKRLYGTYGKFGISKDLITKLFMDGIGQQGFTPLATYNLLRMSLGEELQKHNYLTV